MVITPRVRSSGVRLLILFSAPRGLNEPVRWKSSHLRRAPIMRLVCSGVRARRSPIVARARSTSSRVGTSTTLAYRLEEEHAGARRGVEAVGGARGRRDCDLFVREAAPLVAQAFVLRADDERGWLRQVGVRVAAWRVDDRGDFLRGECAHVVEWDACDRQGEDRAGRSTGC